jgi:hypothetical protein
VCVCVCVCVCVRETCFFHAFVLASYAWSCWRMLMPARDACCCCLSRGRACARCTYLHIHAFAWRGWLARLSHIVRLRIPSLFSQKPVPQRVCRLDVVRVAVLVDNHAAGKRQESDGVSIKGTRWRAAVPNDCANTPSHRRKGGCSCPVEWIPAVLRTLRWTLCSDVCPRGRSSRVLL